MIAETSDLQAVDSIFETILAKRREKRKLGFDPESLAFLALVPVWTCQLADRCKFPLRGTWDTFLAEATSAGLVQLELPVAEQDPEMYSNLPFWMPESARAQVGQELKDQNGREFIKYWAHRLGVMIADSAPDDPSVPAITRHWAQLAREIAFDSQININNDAGGSKLAGIVKAGIVRQVRKHETPPSGDTDQAAQVLLQQVADLARQRKSGEAYGWIEAGRMLAAMVGGTLAGYILPAKRSVERVIRQDVDRRYLSRFIERASQITAFHELMRGPDEIWALHYLGMGGVGKTMLLRHIGDISPREYKSPVARIDFDYLSSNYPVWQPGQLLLALAEELGQYFTAPEHQRAYKVLSDSRDSLQEVISGEPAPSDPLTNLHRPEFDEVLRLFTELLKSLLATANSTRGQGDPQPRIVLILDTCEELVKLQSGEGAGPRLAAAFEIIERVHEKVPSVRIILAGRRLLSLGGIGWRAAAGQFREVQSYLSPVKLYLRLHLMRGFERDEANQLFDRIETKERLLPIDVRTVILSVSQEHGTPTSVLADEGYPLLLTKNLYERLSQTMLDPSVRTYLTTRSNDENLGLILHAVPVDSGPEKVIDLLLEKSTSDGRNVLVVMLRRISEANQSSEVAALADELEAQLTRYSPFSLSLYAQWYVDDPDLTAEKIQSGGVDPYIELRIVRRIEPEKPVRQLLPAVVLLRRFTAEMLKPAFAGSATDFSAAFNALGDHEWLDRRYDPETEKTWLEVDPNLYPRLRAYFERTDRDSLNQTRQILFPELVKQVRDSLLRNLAAETIAAALSLLPDVDAADLWSEVESRVPEQADWTWGLNVACFALSAEADDIWHSRPLIKAALTATNAAANLQLQCDYDPSPIWQQAMESLPQPDAHTAEIPLALWLRSRATLGQVAALQRQNRLPNTADFEAVLRVLQERTGDNLSKLTSHQLMQLDAALSAALEVVVDAVEKVGEGDSVSLIAGIPAQLGIWILHLTNENQRLFAFLLAARLRSCEALKDIARDAWSTALSLAEKIEVDKESATCWADWRAPSSFRNRFRLERLHASRNMPADGPDEVPAEELSDWLQDLARQGAISDIDSERLASATISRLLELSLVDGDLLDKLEGAYRYEPTRQPLCLAHRRTPPLFLGLARGWIALGEVTKAERLLRSVEESGTRAAADALGLADVQRGLIEVVRRMRDSERASGLLAGQATLDWPNPDVWAMAVLAGTFPAENIPAPAESWDDARLHSWWRSQYDLTRMRLKQALILVERGETNTDLWSKRQNYSTLIANASLVLDARENSLIVGKREIVTSKASFLLHQLSDNPRSKQSADRAQESLRLLLRWTTLEAFPILMNDWARRLIQWDWLTSENTHNTAAVHRLIPGSIGTRRAAEMALDEGELLALRLPERAAPLLKQAYKWFLEVGDQVGSTQASILWTLSAIRSGDIDEANRALEEVRAAYEQLCKVRSEDYLPGWLTLEALVSALDADALDRAVQIDDWRGWLVRLIACLLWEKARTASKSSQDDVWSEALAWFSMIKIGSLTPELLPLSAIKSASTVSNKMEKRSNIDFWSSTRGLALIAGIVLLIGAAICIGALLLFRALITPLVPAASTNLGVSIGLFVAVILVFMLLFVGFRRLRRAIRSRLASRARIGINLRPSSMTLGTPEAATGKPRATGEGAAVVTDIRLQLSKYTLNLRPPFTRFTEPATQQEQIGFASGLPYAEAAGDGIKSQILDNIYDLAQRAGHRGALARLEVALELNSYPWEAWLAMAAFQKKSGTPLSLRFARTRLTDHPRTRSDLSFTPGDVRVAVSEKWAGLFEGAWLSKQGKQQSPRPRVGPEVYRIDPADNVYVFHVIGHPINTASGPRVQIDSAEHGVSSYVKEAPARSTGGLLGARDLVQSAFGQVGRLAILQAEPVTDVVDREATRSESAYLRALAGEVFAAGIPTVLMLPALPADLARSVVRHVAGALERSSFDRSINLKLWLDAVDRIRTEIIGWTPRTRPNQSVTDYINNTKKLEAALAETAWDVTLFWSSNDIPIIPVTA